jgi:hypothetical protein
MVSSHGLLERLVQQDPVLDQRGADQVPRCTAAGLMELPVPVSAGWAGGLLSRRHATGATG